MSVIREDSALLSSGQSTPRGKCLEQTSSTQLILFFIASEINTQVWLNLSGQQARKKSNQKINTIMSLMLNSFYDMTIVILACVIMPAFLVVYLLSPFLVQCYMSYRAQNHIFVWFLENGSRPHLILRCLNLVLLIYVFLITHVVWGYYWQRNLSVDIIKALALSDISYVNAVNHCCLSIPCIEASKFLGKSKSWSPLPQ